MTRRLTLTAGAFIWMLVTIRGSMDYARTGDVAALVCLILGALWTLIYAGAAGGAWVTPLGKVKK